MTTQYTQELQQAFIDKVAAMVTAIEKAFNPPHPDVDLTRKPAYGITNPDEPTVCLSTQWKFEDFVLRFYAFADATRVRESLKKQSVERVPVEGRHLINDVERLLAEETLVDSWTARQWLAAMRVLVVEGYTLHRYLRYPSRLPMIEFTKPGDPIALGWLYELPADQVDKPAEVNHVVH